MGQGNWLRHRLSKGREIHCAPADSGVRAAQGLSPSSSLAELIWLVRGFLAKPRGNIRAVSRLFLGRAAQLRGVAPHSAGQRLRHGRFRQVVPYPGQRSGCGRAVDNWPLGWGFDHYWGFLSGAAGQYDPIITQDNAVIGVPEGVDGKTYYFPDDLTDKAVQWLHAVRAQDAQKPWMMYYSTGCSHAPHHVAKEWADMYKASSTMAGTPTGQRPGTAEETRDRPAGHRTDRSPAAVPGVGQLVRRAKKL